MLGPNFVKKLGGRSRARTCDPGLVRAVLFQLSYPPVSGTTIRCLSTPSPSPLPHWGRGDQESSIGGEGSRIEVEQESGVVAERIAPRAAVVANRRPAPFMPRRPEPRLERAVHEGLVDPKAVAAVR